MVADPQQPELPAEPMDRVIERLRQHTSQLELLGKTVAGHQQLLAQLGADVKLLMPDNAGRGHMPIPTPRWHDLVGTERATAVTGWDWVRRVTSRCTATSRPGWAPAGQSIRSPW
jgi:hypothetical protein